MRFILVGVVVFVLSLTLGVSRASASLVTITQDGEIVVNVLAVDDSITLDIPQAETFEVTDIAETVGDENSVVSIEREGGKISMTISSPDTGNRKLDVTGYEDDLVEIEERERTKVVKLGVVGDRLSIEQRNVVALTSLPINIDPTRKELSLTTSSGRRFVSILPQEAVDSLMRTKLINSYDPDSELEIVEDENGNATYLVEGTKVIDMFNVYDYELDVAAVVSATTGELIGINNPEWLKFFNFLFV
jgi:hypothetical protein